MKNQANRCHRYRQSDKSYHIVKRYTAGILLLILTIGFLNKSGLAQPLAKDKDKFLGCATSSYIYRYLENYFNQVTPGNAGKWGSVEPVQGQYNWTDLDKIYNYAINRDIPFKEHTLIWNNQKPYWISSLNSQRKEPQ